MSTKAEVPGYARGPNLPLVKAMMGLASAATKHQDRRTRRRRTRRDQRGHAIREQLT